MYFSIIPSSQTNKEVSFFQQSVKRALLIVTFALRAIKSNHGSITVTMHVWFKGILNLKKNYISSCNSNMNWNKLSFNIVHIICYVSKDVTSINIKLPPFCYISHVQRRPPSFWRQCGFVGTPSDAICYHKNTLSRLPNVLHVLPFITHNHTSSQWPFVYITLVAIYPSNTLIPNFSERWWPRK